MRFLLGFISGLCIVACTSFSFDRYGVSLREQKLKHYDKPAKDLDLNVCDEGDPPNYKCVAMFTDEFYALKSEYERCQASLVLCEKRCP